MYPKPLQNLIDVFAKFPGIGPRQATRFAFFVFRKESEFSQELVDALQGLAAGIAHCRQCYRTIEDANDDTALCLLCANPRREQTLIAVVEKESDLHSMERTGAFTGRYHTLNGVISPLDPDSPKRLHLAELHERIQKILTKHGACEVILATSATTEGDTTALYIDQILAPLKEQHATLKTSRLGRGLSLGAELEYADEVTLKNALANRK